MRKIVMIFALVGGVMLASCSSLFMNSSLVSSDLYRSDNRVTVANRIKAEAEAERAEAEAREAQWAARQAEAEAERAEAEYYASLAEQNYQTIVANDYESAYARRLYGFNSPTYNLPSSYYDLYYNPAMHYATAYDPALYNIMVSGNQVWVEPKFITSMFGSWGATNVSFGIYSSPWNYGWNYRVDPFYYSCWGYPRYSWYDWNWTVCYNPWYYDSYYWSHYHHHYYHHYHNHYYPHRPVAPRPPKHRPNRPDNNRPDHGFVTTGPGASAGPVSGNHNGGRDNSGTRYTSPTSNKNFGGSTVVTRPITGGGTVSTGVNDESKYRGTTTVTVDRGTATTTTKGSDITTPVTVDRGTTTTTTGSGTDNFRQGTTNNTNKTTTTTTTTPTTTTKGRVNTGTTTTDTKVDNGTSTSTRRGTTTNSTTVNRGTSATGNRTTTRTTTTTTTRTMGGGSTSTGSVRGGGNTSSRR